MPDFVYVGLIDNPSAPVSPAGVLRSHYLQSTRALQISVEGQPYRDLGLMMHNVRDFGAVGDGVANDASAIGSAVTAAYSSGRPVYFPAGTYNLAMSAPPGPIVVTNDLVFVGEGREKVTLKITNYTPPGASSNVFIYVNAKREFTLRGITLEGPTSGISSQSDVCFGIFSEGGDGGLVTVEDSRLWRFNQCIKISYDPSTGYGGKLHCRRSLIQGRGLGVLHINGTSTAAGAPDMMESIYELCQFQNDPDCVTDNPNVTYNLYIDSAVSTRVISCRFTGNRGRCIRRGGGGALRTRFNQYIGCVAERFQVGFETAAGNHTEIIGCDFEAFGSNGSWTAWAPSTGGHIVGMRKKNGTNGAGTYAAVYEVISINTGVSGVGSGPSGFGSSIADGGVTWKFLWLQTDPGAIIIPQGNNGGQVGIIGCNFGALQGIGQSFIDSNFGGSAALVKVMNCTFNRGYGATGHESGHILNIFKDVAKPWIFENCDFYDGPVGSRSVFWTGGRCELINCRWLANPMTAQFCVSVRGGFVKLLNCYNASNKPQCYTEAKYDADVEVEFIGCQGASGSVNFQLQQGTGGKITRVHGHSNRWYESVEGSTGGNQYVSGTSLQQGDLQFGYGFGTPVRHGAGPYVFQANWNRDTYELDWGSTPQFTDIEIADGGALGNGTPYVFPNRITNGAITLIAKQAFELNHNAGTAGAKILLKGAVNKTVAANESVRLRRSAALDAWVEE